MPKGKLELTWVGKDERPRLEPRVLVEDPSKSYGDPDAENMLIYGDNLLALKALEQDFASRVKCIYIDPPYNTGAAFETYDDGKEHSLWLSLVRDRLHVLRSLLTNDGSLWISIDDNEYAYLRVLCDEVFGRHNFVTTVIWEKRKSRENRRVFSFKHDYVVVFARDRFQFEKTRNLLPLSQEVLARYRNPDSDPRGPWQSVSALAQAGHGTASQFYTLTAPSGKKHTPPDGNCWRYTKKKMESEIKAGNIWFGKSGKNAPRIKRLLSEHKDSGLTPETIWYADDVGTNDGAKRHLLALFDGKAVFDTPKPEGLIHRVLQVASNSGDWVLDSFAGSGTTGAVAQKMKRKWILVEHGSHCDEVIVPRMRKVVDGADGGGITQSESWKGGGGFKYYRLAESLLVRDKDLSTTRHPVYIINPRYNEKLLIRAICKVENFRYRNEGRLHGVSSESRFLHVTTRLLTQGYLDSLAEDIGPDQSLLIYCTRRSRGLEVAENIEIKKIPRDLLAKCDFEEGK